MGTSVEAQGIILPAAPVCVLGAPLPVQLPASWLGKAAADGPGAQAPAAWVGDPDEAQA